MSLICQRASSASFCRTQLHVERLLRPVFDVYSQSKLGIVGVALLLLRPAEPTNSALQSFVQRPVEAYPPLFRLVFLRETSLDQYV
eukprot:m.272338 g.272338  ORF g.272338 m.272338 type:complete len:86 (+) comp40561_c0_seq6:40-297(+)